MSAFALNRNYELILPEGYVSVENEEMEYVDGGGFYISNRNLKNVLAACALNPIGTTLLAFGYWKAVGFISAKFGLLCGKLGSFAGPFASLVLWAIGSLSAGAVAMSVVDALYAGKGLYFGFTWRPTIDVQ